MKDNPKHLARWIKIAFEQGKQAAHDEDSWENSTAKQIHDQLLMEAQGGVNVKS